MSKTLEYRLKKFSEKIQGATTSDFGYDPYTGGAMERAVAEASVEVCEKIGGMLEEMLNGEYDED